MEKIFVWISATFAVAVLWLAQIFIHMMLTDTPTIVYQVQIGLAVVICPCLGMFAASRYRR